MSDRLKLLAVAFVVVASAAGVILWLGHEARGPKAIPEDKLAQWELTRAFAPLRFERPLWMQQLADGRWLLLLEQAGRIRAFREGTCTGRGEASRAATSIAARGTRR